MSRADLRGGRGRGPPAPRRRGQHVGGVRGARRFPPHGRPVARVAPRCLVRHRRDLRLARQGARVAVGRLCAGGARPAAAASVRRLPQPRSPSPRVRGSAREPTSAPDRARCAGRGATDRASRRHRSRHRHPRGGSPRRAGAGARDPRRDFRGVHRASPLARFESAHLERLHAPGPAPDRELRAGSGRASVAPGASSARPRARARAADPRPARADHRAHCEQRWGDHWPTPEERRPRRGDAALAGRARPHPEGPRSGHVARGAGPGFQPRPTDAGANRGRQAVTEALGPALTLGQLLDEAAARDPSREAVVFRGERVSYGELKARVDSFALGLIALGLAPGDHAVLWMPNRVEWNVAHLAIAKAGGVTVTCNSRYKAFEVEYVLRQSDAKVLILADRFDAASIDYLEIFREICLGVDTTDGTIASPRLPALRHVVVLGSRVPPGGRSWTEVEDMGRRAERSTLERVRIEADDPAVMLYTSGTTGEPKGCLLSHGNVYYKCRVYVA